MIQTKLCRNCNRQYSYALYANFIQYCPNCNKYDFLECDYGYGPICPCYIAVGEEKVAEITEQGRRYVLNIYNINKKFVLKEGYSDLACYNEAMEIYESM